MDPVGRAIYDHHFNADRYVIRVDTNYTEDEEIDPAFFFRDYDEMPYLEHIALDLCKGRVLDIGAGAGSHTLELQKKGLDVTALDKSPLACKVMSARGVRKVLSKDITGHGGAVYDTLLLLMNGAGIAGTLEGLERLLVHLKSLLAPGGQILMDSTDIRYLFEEDDGSVWIDLSRENYFGEMSYTLTYKNRYTATFPWLFADFETLSKIAGTAGFATDRVAEGEENNFLARLTPVKA